MKKIFLLIAITLLLTFFACGKINQTVTVVRDCTGTYLRIDNKDYHVCNIEKVASFADGSSVTASFRKISKCSDPTSCNMVHSNEGWIEVEKIK